MSNMKVYQEKFEKLQTRERGLVLLVLLTFLYMLWTLAFGSQLENQAKQLQLSASELNIQLDTQNIELASLAVAQQQDPDQLLRGEVSQLNRDIEQIDQALAAMAVGLVPAHELPSILESVLLKTGSLALVSLQTLPIEELRLSTQLEATETMPATGVYRHSVLLALRGGYFDLNDYLLALEQLPWHFYWDSLSYQVDSFPTANITLKVYTLSTERGVVGG